jgi:phosphate transport system protein
MMARQTLERDLRHLQDEMLFLACTVNSTIVQSVDYLKERNFYGSRRLMEEDQRINEKRAAIEAETLTVIATQQPAAGDLRVLASILEISGELERIGDYTKGISRINLMIGDRPLIKPLVDLPRMAAKAREMLSRAIEAFVNRDVVAARAIPVEDDEVDDLYNQIYRELVTYILADPSVIDQSNHLLWAAHNLERTADRVTNICERVVFTVTGKTVNLGKENGGSGKADSAGNPARAAERTGLPCAPGSH